MRCPACDSMRIINKGEFNLCLQCNSKFINRLKVTELQTAKQTDRTYTPHKSVQYTGTTSVAFHKAEVKALLDGGMKRVDIARKLGISQLTIQTIVKGLRS